MLGHSQQSAAQAPSARSAGAVSLTTCRRTGGQNLLFQGFSMSTGSEKRLNDRLAGALYICSIDQASTKGKLHHITSYSIHWLLQFYEINCHLRIFSSFSNSTSCCDNQQARGPAQQVRASPVFCHAGSGQSSWRSWPRGL